ncbi:MAG: cobalamin-binding protein [Pseudomonadota bacterium]
MLAPLAGADEAGTHARGVIHLPDAGGESLQLTGPAQRIITLAPHLTELAYYAGIGDRLVATVTYSDFPAAAAELPQIGDAFRFDLERMVTLEPDLVIAWDSGNSEAALTTMTQLGLPVWRTRIASVQDMADVLRQLGHATAISTDGIASAVEARWADIISARDRHASVSFFYQIAERPLYTVNGEHLISQGLSACGGVNVFEDLPTLAPQIGPEAVLQADPQVIFTGYGGGDTDPLAHWRNWPRMAAVQHDGLFTLEADLINRATPRFLDAIDTACALLDDYRVRTAALP